MSPQRRAAARWAIAIVLLVVILSRFDLAAVGTRLSSVNPLLAVLGIVGLVAVHLVGALTWRRLHERLLGVRLEWTSTIRLYYAAQAVGSVTPANLGADVYRVAAVQDGTPRGSIALPIVVQRLTSIGALLVLGAIGSLVLAMVGGAALRASLGPTLGASISVVLLVLGASAAILAGWSRWAGRLRARLLASAGAPGGPPGARGAWPAAIREGLGLGLAFHVLSLGLGLVLVAAVDPSTAARTPEALAALAVARLSLAIPITPSGLGIQEGALAILFVQLGFQADVALAAVLLNRLSLVIVLIGGAIALLAANRTAETATRTATRTAIPPATREGGTSGRAAPNPGADRPPAAVGPG